MTPIFFTVRPHNQMPKGSAPQHQDPDKLNKVREALNKATGNILSGENLDKIYQFLLTAGKSNSSFKIGHLIAGIAEHTLNSLVHDESQHVAITHYNEKQSNSEIQIHRTHVYIGEKHNSKIQSYLNGPVHEAFEKRIIDSQCDWLDTKNRKELQVTTGVNQRGYAILDKNTFLTLKDVLELTNHKEHKASIDAQLNYFLLTTGENKIPKEIKDTLLKNLKTRESEKAFLNFYSALLSTKTEIKIMNRMPVYDANITVHLVKLRQLDGDVRTIEALVNDVTKVPDKECLERINPKDLFGIDVPDKNSTSIHFARKLYTNLKVNLTKLQSFKKNFIVVRSWRRKVPTGGHWYITINEKFRNGIHLNRLNELRSETERAPNDLPINHFLIIEYYGDNRASVFRNADNETISSVYSPCILNFEYKLDIKHLSHTKDPDEILCYKRVKKIKEFEDESIGLEFYPNRETKFNVDFNNITIGEEKTKKEANYKLELNSSILENQQMSNFESLLNKLKQIDPDTASTITEDDIPFMSNLRGTEKDKTDPEV
jgi:hypothetical protein